MSARASGRTSRLGRRGGAAGLLAVCAVALAALGWVAASSDVAPVTLGGAACLPAIEVGPGGDAQALAVPAFAQAVRGLEPALPATRSVDDLPVPPEHPLHDDVRYLRERGLLPATYHPDTFDAEGWRRMLEAFLRGYGLPGLRTPASLAPGAVAADLEHVVTLVQAVSRPVALLAWEPEDAQRLAFVGVVLNWSPYPRMLVMRPPDGWSMRDGASVLAGRISLCGKPVEDWVSASAPVAQALFVQHADDAPMYVVGSIPDTRGWPYRIEAGGEVAAFTFDHPELVDLELYSAVFVADPMSVVQVARLVPQVRTNLSPVALARALQTPPRRD